LTIENPFLADYFVNAGHLNSYLPALVFNRICHRWTDAPGKPVPLFHLCKIKKNLKKKKKENRSPLIIGPNTRVTRRLLKSTSAPFVEFPPISTRFRPTNSRPEDESVDSPRYAALG
jgi:hypothetical protein